MMESEQNNCTTIGSDERNMMVHEYEVVVESLLRDLEMCKGDQMHLREELEILRRDTKSTGEVAKQSFSLVSEDYQNLVDNNYQESLSNLQTRLSIMEKEKETVFQLWQTSLTAIDALEEELKLTQTDGKATKYYEEQVNHVKETYSEAIRAMEAKLIQAKENFVKNQALWEINRERTETLSKEKIELERKIAIFQNESQVREESDRKTIQSLQSELVATRSELERISGIKLELQERLQDAQTFTARIIAKDEEAIELVETAVKEKEMAELRESRALEERSKMEARLNNIIEECTTRLDRELIAAKETFERNNKKYVLEIKELKAELREKVTLLDRAEREKRMVEEELTKVRDGYEDFIKKSGTTVLELEQKLKEANFKIETCEESVRRKYEEKIRQADERITELEARLVASGDRLRRTQLFSSKEFDERIRESDERTKEVLDRYSILERRFARALDEKENFASELRSLQTTYDREIARRDNERRLQDSRIRELQDDLQNANGVLEKANARGNALMKQIESLQLQGGQKKENVANDNDTQTTNVELTLRLKTLQEKFDQRTMELTQHVETHQKLCGRWKDEAKSLAMKFQSRTKELRGKINDLRVENEELNKELLVCRQQLAHCRVEVLHRYDQGDGNR